MNKKELKEYQKDIEKAFAHCVRPELNSIGAIQYKSKIIRKFAWCLKSNAPIT